MKKNLRIAIGIILCLVLLFACACTPNSPQKNGGNQVGDACYDFSVTTYNGKGEFKLSEQKGKIVIINFWATWCVPCVNEMPEFERIASENEDVEVVAIHSAYITANEGVENWLKAQKDDSGQSWSDYDITFAQDRETEDFASTKNSEIHNRLGGEAYPLSVIVDKEGVIRFVNSASIDYETLNTQVKLLKQGSGDEDKGQMTYSVALSCEDTLILGALIVQIKAEDGTVVAEREASSDIMTFTLEKGTYTVNLAEIPGFEGTLLNYTYNIPTLTDKVNSAQIVLSPKTETSEAIEYKVIVKRPDGSTVGAGVNVQLCGGPSYVCNFATTDQNGVAVFSLVPGDYEVHIEPQSEIEGYTFDNTKYKMTSDGGELEVFLQQA